MVNSKTKGDTNQPPNISIGKEFVYLRSNLEQVTDTDEFGEERTYWQWDEEIVPLKQYIEQITSRADDSEDAIAELSILIAGGAV